MKCFVSWVSDDNREEEREINTMEELWAFMEELDERVICGRYSPYCTKGEDIPHGMNIEVYDDYLG